MYQYQDNVLSIPAKLLYNELSLISYKTYQNWCERGKLLRTKYGRGKGNTAWISFYDISEEWIKNAVKAFLGDPKKVVIVNELEKYIEIDRNAYNFFATHKTPKGEHLTPDKQIEKADTAMVFNAIEKVFKERGALVRNKPKAWLNISEAINDLATKLNEGYAPKYKFKLPSNSRSLKRKYKKYLTERYSSLIHGNEGHENSRKVTSKIEGLIISLYCLPNRPYSVTVHDLYLQFLGGAIEVYDIKTGEIFDREDFYDENNKPVEICEDTVRRYLKSPKNDVIIKKRRNKVHDFNLKVRPHVHRYAPNYSMSKVTLDDRDIMHTRLKNGGKVMAYYAFDDMSGAMIGISHSKEKTHDLYLDCLRNMFRFLSSKNIGTPMQMEVEHHLVKDFSEGLMKAGNLFPFVRWCNPGNSQEKYAENRIRVKKYGVEKLNNQNVGRHYSKLDSNRVIEQKIFNELNDTYKKASADYKKIIENELKEMVMYNNQLHHNQKKYKGLTRMQVFLQNVNPDVTPINKALLAKYIGFSTETSIKRNQYARVQYMDFQLETPQKINLLEPNNYDVTAYYLPENNEIKEVFLYQKDKLISVCEPVPNFNRANAEWTDKDKKGFFEAKVYISDFDEMVREDTKDKLQKVSIIRKENIPIIDIEVETIDYIPNKEPNYESTITEETEEEIKNRAFNEL